MHLLVEKNREAIARLCTRHGVIRLEAFGSVLRDDFDSEESDIDFLVEFSPSVSGSFTNYLNLKESMESLLHTSVDLVELDAIRNRRLQQHIESSRAVVYVAPADERDQRAARPRPLLSKKS